MTANEMSRQSQASLSVFILKIQTLQFINIDAVNNINKIVAPLGNLN
jgi:hypothetical protein